MLRLYRALAYFGLASIFGALLWGFRHDSSAPRYHYAIDVLLYAAYILPHLVMTRAWFKGAVWNQPGGSPAERRVYITVASVLWIVIFAIHRPVSGFALALPTWAGWAPFMGILTFILFIPIEEAQLIAGRGDAYRAYQQQTRYRLFYGMW
jgi:protein-S-isoprenylcysteine O-methyltransferase Ste14